MTGETIVISLIDPEPASPAWLLPDMGRVVGDIRLLRAIISNCRYDGPIASFGRTTGP
jgi:hypothetical protein